MPGGQNKCLLSALLALIISLPLSAHSGLDYTRTQLPNGLTLLTIEDHYAPLTSILLMYRAGIKNDPPGKTGITKLCQQILFEGTESFSRNDYSKTIQSGGGTIGQHVGLDVTYFASKFPAEMLDTILVMELDRMHNVDFTYEKLLMAKKYLQQKRIADFESQLYPPLEMELLSAAYRAYPYRNPFYGWPEDLDNIEFADIKEHYKKYFSAANAVIVIVGDFNTSSVIERIKKLADWYASGKAPEPINISEPEHRWERSSTLTGRGDVPAFIVGYLVPPADHPDIPALMALNQILNMGESSRIYRRLVAEEQLSMVAGGNLQIMEGPGILISWSIMNYDSPLAEGERLLFDEIEKIREEPVSHDELTKAKNQIKAGYYRLLTALDRRAYRRGYYLLFLDDITYGEKITDAVQSVTADDIMRVAGKYLKRSNRTVARMLPEETDKESFQNE
jgi:zinc protease